MENDHLQPQHRKPFAQHGGPRMDSARCRFEDKGRRDSLVNYLRECNLRQRRDLQISKGTEGSNPSPSATQSEVQRNLPGFLWKLRKRAASSRLLLSNRTGENVLLICFGELCGQFLP